jgi:DNA-binding CsgD family transcriptional regulator
MGKPRTAPMIEEQPVFQMLDWLTFRPSADELARGLVTDYLRPYGANKARFTLLADDDSLHYVGTYGCETYSAGHSQTATQWRARTDAVTEVFFNDNFVGFNPDKTILGAAIRDRGISKGSCIVFFDEPVKEHGEVLDLMTKLSRVIGFYLINSYASVTSNKGGGVSPREVSRSDFTPRQIQIMQGMVEGKTNHELATDLGYSVSTVRHETMRIFQILGVSDRREAARAALDRSII